MNAKENFNAAVAKVRALLQAVNLAETVPGAPETTGADTLKDYVTETGVTVKIDRLETGGKVYMEDGTTPVTSGFSLSDGTVVTVDESGSITAVVVPSPVEAAAPVIPAVPAAPPNYDARFEALEAELAALKAANQKFSDAAATDAKLQTMSDAVNKTLDIVEQFAAAPSADPVVKPSGEPDKPTKADLREAFAKNIAARKTAV